MTFFQLQYLLNIKMKSHEQNLLNTDGITNEDK